MCFPPGCPGLYVTAAYLGVFLCPLWYNCYGDIMLERTKLILGDKIDLLDNKRVLVLGLGGVGGYVVESLIRSGIKDIVIVDNDTIDITNLNRQIVTTTNNIGKYKTEE